MLNIVEENISNIISIIFKKTLKKIFVSYISIQISNFISIFIIINFYNLLNLILNIIVVHSYNIF